MANCGRRTGRRPERITAGSIADPVGVRLAFLQQRCGRIVAQEKCQFLLFQRVFGQVVPGGGVHQTQPGFDTAQESIALGQEFTSSAQVPSGL